MSVKPDAIIIEGHVQGLSNLRSLGEKQLSCWVIDKSSCIAQYSKYCNKFILCPEFNSIDFIDFLIDLAKSKGIENCVLIPSNDHAVLSLYTNAERLKKYYLFPENDLVKINTIYNKFELCQLANRVGVSTPKFVESTIESLNFPVLVKGKRGLDFYKKYGKKVVLLNSHEDYIAFSKNNTDSDENIFFQELINKDDQYHTVSFACYSELGIIKHYWCGEKLAEHPVRFGTATVAQSVQITELEEIVQKILQELNYSGVCEIEFLYDDQTDQFNLIEINARTWLWVELAKRCGIDLVSILFFRLKKQTFESPRNSNKQLLWYNPFTFLVFTVTHLITGKTKWNIIQTWMQSKKVNALYSSSDRRPFFAYFLSLFSFYKRR
jgi:predicted ATP-grasp superfamily ATP-dependent carboligase